MTKPTIAFLLPILILLTACTESNQKEGKLQKEQISGETMGTTFSITYLDSMGIDPMSDLQALLLAIDRSVSTYNENSAISRFNQGDSLLVDSDGHFVRNFLLSKEIHSLSKGWFNPTVMPLVNYWGFGYTPKKIVTQADSVAIKALLDLVQFDSIRMEIVGKQHLFIKQKKGIELDFSAIAKGDAVDQVGHLFESKGIQNYFVEIGGEVRARGKVTAAYSWRTGIRVPTEDAAATALQLAIELPNLSLATSGNYENFYEDKSSGIKYAHTINPHTGYPEKNRLLSASIFAKDCATADALATAFMAMGLDKAYALAEELAGIEVYLVYSDKQGVLQEKYSEKVKELMKK